ncbi:MAG: hypothetical protein P4M09_25655 [Devosia sp.]|nr:hypothetical protein [Devosia sp.]
MDEWPPIVCERFDGEGMDTYRRRSAEVIDIIQGFRNLRFRGEVAEEKEQRLAELQEPLLEHRW